MEIFKSIVTNVLTALYQPFWFAVLLTIFILFFYMYAYHPTDAGKGIKTACIAWVRTFKNSLYFRKLFCFVFFTVMIFRVVAVFQRKCFFSAAVFSDLLYNHDLVSHAAEP